MKSYGISNIGKIREMNQDAFFIQNTNLGPLPNLYIVADGMGGRLGGEIASEVSISSFCEYVKQNKLQDDMSDFLIDATRYANAKVYETSSQIPNYRGMGTTFTTLTIYNNKGYVTHIGDSRIYKITNNTIKLLSNDHSLVNEMVKLGHIKKSEASNHPQKNILTRALGTESTVLVDNIIFDININDSILICSDGLTNMIEDEEIKNIINENSLKEAVHTLVSLANSNGGIDNITTILIKMEGDSNVA